MRRLLTAILVVFAPGTGLADRLIDGVPIPNDAHVETAGAEATESQRQFLGVWTGRWGGELKHILIIEGVAPNGQARVVYAWGDLPKLKIKRGWARPRAALDGDTLTLSGDFSATYKLTSVSSIAASYERGQIRSRAEMERTSLAKLAAGSARVGGGERQSIMLATRLREHGKAVRLQVIIYKPPGNGTFPLVVVNHGSTGVGKTSALFAETWAPRSLAELFVSRGYIVAFPQRRGRGTSEGLYDEGFKPDRAQGYTCEAQLSLAGADRALRDLAAAVEALRERADVARKPVLMMGVSRGGVLSMVYAGEYPEQVAGVINFVGGWMGDGCANATKINSALVDKAAKFPRPTLWIYGEDDPYYSLAHTRMLFAGYRAAGGTGTFLSFAAPNGNGHSIWTFEQLWSGHVDQYLKAISATVQH